MAGRSEIAHQPAKPHPPRATPSDEGSTIIRVAVDAPLPGFFDYLPGPANVQDEIRIGVRVQVPFGRGTRVGLVVARAACSQQPPDRLRSIESVLDPQPLLGPEDLELILWAAKYYRHPPGEALFTALPARLRRARPSVSREPSGWRVTDAGRLGATDGLARAPAQARVIALLLGVDSGFSAPEIRRRLGNCSAALRALARKGWIEPCAPDQEAESAIAPEPAPNLNEQQNQAVNRVRATLGRFQAFLLDGVTGSGKTEVYIQLLQAVLSAGNQALLLVPEIGLTPQLQRRLQRRLQAPMAVLHSGLTAGERERAWHCAASGRAGLVLGTRSAVFVPLPRLALLLVDEEHDLSFKQQDGFRYSARDVGVRRAQLRDCPVVLGSATPSLETLNNAQSGRYDLLSLPLRAGGARPPKLTLLDIRSQPLRGGLSPVLLRLMREQFAAGNQVLLFLNRRGFAPILTCHDCGGVEECPRCDARLTLHQAEKRLWCHHCGHSRPIPNKCPNCASPDLRPLGQGTERLEEGLKALFPQLPLARVDRDSTRRKGELERLLAAARHGDYPLLVGTQMLAKGHHFPGVTLVGILDVDQGLFGADYRAAERMAQLVIQVAGRAGRAQRPGTVVLQTRHPDHPLLLTLQRNGYHAFAAAALQERQSAALPPFAHQALVRAESGERASATEFLRHAQGEAESLDYREVTLLGPVPAPMERRAGRYRAQLLAQANRRSDLQGFLAAWVPRLHALKGRGRIRWSLDVDPQDML